MKNYIRLKNVDANTLNEWFKANNIESSILGNSVACKTSKNIIILKFSEGKPVICESTNDRFYCDFIKIGKDSNELVFEYSGYLVFTSAL